MGDLVRKWEQVEVVSVHDDGLVSDAFVDPTVMDDVSLLVILHALVFRLPDAWEDAVLLDDVVRPLIIIDNLPTVLNQPPAETLHKIDRLSLLHERVSQDSEGVSSKYVCLDPILEPTAGCRLSALAANTSHDFVDRVSNHLGLVSVDADELLLDEAVLEPVWSDEVQVTAFCRQSGLRGGCTACNSRMNGADHTSEHGRLLRTDDMRSQTGRNCVDLGRSGQAAKLFDDGLKLFLGNEKNDILKKEHIEGTRCLLALSRLERVQDSLNWCLLQRLLKLAEQQGWTL